MIPFRYRLFRLLLATLVTLAASGAGAMPPAEPMDAVASGQELERSLQQLPWPAFKAVISAIPKLKADVEAYGPLGWQYVQANYRRYPWAKRIDKLNEEQRRQLADLIAANGKPAPSP